MFVDRDTLNAHVEFDSPFRVHPGNVITHGDVPNGRDYWTPELLDGDMERAHADNWELLEGYTGQYGYNGPVMHDSETLSGGLARDVLNEPGVYVVIASNYNPDPDEPCDYGDCPGKGGTDCEHEPESIIEGWAIARHRNPFYANPEHGSFAALMQSCEANAVTEFGHGLDSLNYPA